MLISAAQDLRYGAMVTLLFCQGWRISEVLGLAWEDLDLDADTAHIRRGATYSPSTGTVLGTTKTSGAQGVHYLAPSSVDHLRRRRKEQEDERGLSGEEWPDHTYAGELLHPVFTTRAGKVVNRQYAVKTIRRAAKKADIDIYGLATHIGRRTVVTALYANGGVDDATDKNGHAAHDEQDEFTRRQRGPFHTPLTVFDGQNLTGDSRRVRCVGYVRASIPGCPNALFGPRHANELSSGIGLVVLGTSSWRATTLSSARPDRIADLRNPCRPEEDHGQIISPDFWFGRGRQ